MERRHFAVRIWVAAVVAVVAAVLFVAVGGASRRAVAATDPGWSEKGWRDREIALRTDTEAHVFAEELGTYYRSIIPMPSRGFFVQKVDLQGVELLRGNDDKSVWRAEYLVKVGSTEVPEYSEANRQVTDFGPGIEPGDPVPPGVDGIYAYADLDRLTTPQRVAFLRYLMARHTPAFATAARLDLPFPDAPWYSDAKVRGALLARGHKLGLGAADLMWVIYADYSTEYLGFDSKSGTWRRVP